MNCEEKYWKNEKGGRWSVRVDDSYYMYIIIFFNKSKKKLINCSFFYKYIYFIIFIKLLHW